MIAGLIDRKLLLIVDKDRLATKLRNTEIEYHNTRIDCQDTKIDCQDAKIDCQETKIENI